MQCARLHRIQSFPNYLQLHIAFYIVVFICTHDSDKSAVGREGVLMRFGTAVGYSAGA